jgi:ADP-ribosyl-[dinitrogen reductase] hydrolase
VRTVGNCWLLDRKEVPNLLVELAIGDAYGAGFEFVDAEMVHKENNLLCYVKHPRHRIRPGAYTDDTQMSLAIAEAIVSGELWSPEMLAGRFVEAFKRDPREGYASGFSHFLQQVRDGEQFLREIRPDSEKNGAAMRAAPLGVYRTISLVIERCTIQAAITHNTPGGINAAVAAALMTHYLLYKLGPKKALGEFLERHVPGNWTTPWRGKVPSPGIASVRAAVTALIDNERMSTLLQACVAFTGDVDTVAAMALAAGSCSSEIMQDLPTLLLDGLENGIYGREYIQELDTKLMTF